MRSYDDSAAPHAVTRTSDGDARRAAERWAVLAGIVGPLVFAGAWLLGGAIEGDRYSVVRDSISDLAARTATHPWMFLTGEVIGGLCDIAFVLYGLRPSLRPSRARALAIAAAVTAGLTGVLDPLTRLDCRQIDGCTAAQQTYSLSGQGHEISSLIDFLGTVICLLALSVVFRHQATWRRWSFPTVLCALAMIALVVATGAPSTAAVHGLTERALALMGGLYSLSLAVHLARGRAVRPSALVSAHAWGPPWRRTSS